MLVGGCTGAGTGCAERAGGTNSFALGLRWNSLAAGFSVDFFFSAGFSSEAGAEAEAGAGAGAAALGSSGFSAVGSAAAGLVGVTARPSAEAAAAAGSSGVGVAGLGLSLRGSSAALAATGDAAVVVGLRGLPAPSAFLVCSLCVGSLRCDGGLYLVGSFASLVMGRTTPLYRSSSS